MTTLHRVSSRAGGCLIVKVSLPLTEAERIGQALAVAAAGVAGGHRVSLWLAGESVRLGVPGGTDALVPLPESAPPGELLAILLADATVTACAPCAARRALTADDLLPGVRLAGAAALVAEVMSEGARALVY